jgi:hypothetical protein
MTNLNLNLSNDLHPDKTYEVILNESAIIIVWEEGFGENSKTMGIFRDWYGYERAENACLDANLGGSYNHTIFLSNGEDALWEAKELIFAGEYSHIILKDRSNENDTSCYPLIFNKLIKEVAC